MRDWQQLEAALLAGELLAGALLAGALLAGALLAFVAFPLSARGPSGTPQAVAGPETYILGPPLMTI